MNKFSYPFVFALFVSVGSSALADNLTVDALKALSNIMQSNKNVGGTKHNVVSANTNVKANGQCPEHYPLGAPIVVSPQKDKIERRSFYLCRTGYAVQFDPATKTPLWSAEKLNAEILKGAKEPRTDDFQADPNVPGPAQATLNDYKGSRFDRGHMSPAADQAGRDGNAMSQSFYLTNMVPQVGVNQNRGIWADLEAQVRKWAEQRGEVLVVTGPIFDQGTATIGHSQVWVPTRLYKVVIDPKTFESIAFIIPNRQIITKKTRQLDNGNPQFPQTQPEQAVKCSEEGCTTENFVVNVATVEQATGLKFFSALKDADHQTVTQNISRSWKFKR